jgi:hypothetical protein
MENSRTYFCSYALNNTFTTEKINRDKIFYGNYHDCINQFHNQMQDLFKVFNIIINLNEISITSTFDYEIIYETFCITINKNNNRDNPECFKLHYSNKKHNFDYYYIIIPFPEDKIIINKSPITTKKTTIYNINVNSDSLVSFNKLLDCLMKDEFSIVNSYSVNL